MIKKIILPFLICLISLSGFGQSRFNTGLYLGYGKLQDYRLLHGGVKVEYDLNSKFSINSGVQLNTTSILEIPFQLQYNLASTKKIHLNVFSGIAVNYILLKKTHFQFHAKSLEDYKYEVSVYGKKAENPLTVALSNGIAIRFSDRLDINFTYNYGINDVILINSEQFLVDHPIDWKKLQVGFFDDPDQRIRNSYFALGIVFWNPLPTAERKAEIRSNKLHRSNAIFVEMLGTLHPYSINYDRIILSTNNQKVNGRIAGRAGINYLKDKGSSDINYSFGISGLLGRNGHYFELGLGIQIPPNDYYEFGYHNFIGYRYQKNIFFLRGGMTILNLGREVAWSVPALGLGVAF